MERCDICSTKVAKYQKTLDGERFELCDDCNEIFNTEIHENTNNRNLEVETTECRKALRNAWKKARKLHIDGMVEIIINNTPGKGNTASNDYWEITRSYFPFEYDYAYHATIKFKGTKVYDNIKEYCAPGTWIDAFVKSFNNAVEKYKARDRENMAQAATPVNI